LEEGWGLLLFFGGIYVFAQPMRAVVEQGNNILLDGQVEKNFNKTKTSI
jgi:hypothetical protein